MKKFILSFILMMLGFTSVVNANSINSITMNIYIDESGDANVTEIWDCVANEGTEFCHPYHDLIESKIKNLQVKDEYGILYTTVPSWNVEDSFENKKYKCGISKISNDFELHWGISEYGSKVYVLNYEIDDLVINLMDSQMVYWPFVSHNFLYHIDKTEIIIHSYQPFDENLNTCIYSKETFNTRFQDGVLKVYSNGGLDKDKCRILLISFPKGTFNTSTNLTENIDYYSNMAKYSSGRYGNSYYGLSSPSFLAPNTISIKDMIWLFGGLLWLGWMFFLIIRETVKSIKNGTFRFK